MQLSAGQVPAVQEAAGRPEQVQEVQEGSESIRTLLGSVREVLLAQSCQTLSTIAILCSLLLGHIVASSMERFLCTFFVLWVMAYHRI